MKIVDIDVGSYYPSMMLEYGYISRSIPSAEGYTNVYNTRIKAKHEGDDETAGALKLVLNSTYGAMKNQYKTFNVLHSYDGYDNATVLQVREIQKRS